MDQSVFMIGWEYPPHNSGGLGEACQGLTQAMAGQGQQLYFTLPYPAAIKASHMQVIGAYNPDWFLNTAADQPPFAVYTSIPTPIKNQVDAHQLRALPQTELELRVNEYADKVVAAAGKVGEDFSVIHAHDWMSFPAAANLKHQTGKPLVAHVHSTEFDRIPNGSGSPFITATEYHGLKVADRVIAVSKYTKRMIIKHYQVDPNKIDVVYNGIDPLTKDKQSRAVSPKHRPTIVFMGRLTSQKGGSYFVDLAERVLKVVPDALFIVAGHGDQFQSLLLQTASASLSAHVLFTGFVRGQAKADLLNRADVFIMPSLSEPFGLVALEAAQRQTPVIVSKNSGVAEVLPSAMQADFWDLDLMTEQVVSVVTNSKLARSITSNQLKDVSKVTWQRAASRVQSTYMRAFGS